MTRHAPLTYPRWIALALARALQADDHLTHGRSVDALLARAMQCLDDGARPWLLPLCRALAAWPEPMWRAQTVRTLADRLQTMAPFDERQDASTYDRWRVRRLLLRPTRQLPLPFALEGLTLPALPTESSVAEWLDLTLDELDWLAGDAHRYREATATPQRPQVTAARHYQTLLLTKRRGGLRLIEAPLPRLKAVQRRVLTGLLAQVPVHEAAHGFVPGRNVATHAAGHAGAAFVVSFDLQDFFPSIGRARIEALFRTLGYAEAVAGRLAALCTTRTPATVRERLAADGPMGPMGFLGVRRLASPHLPQGAPTSPALANLCAFGLDLRLDGLAHRFGARYSRYADDLVFSGPERLGRDLRTLQAWVQGIIEDEGFRLRHDKTRRMPAAGRQRVTGVVVNTRPNLPREDYDRLRAELHRLAAQGPVDPGLRAPLLGRLAWATQFVVPSRATKLRRMFDDIRFKTPSD
ncbi:reverse transcriptase family protein [Roseateles amylovorans]|uniref:RNA-directed DNA polymerase n=1 Tax=Roseateles amylovorans TaxID=2978473 RepID=A0ABY6B2T6_9BURK|nr:reverse transcriptase family protein [Roseateles amylovorans]UXH79233.1 reverse transcriptase family protein [Roseateles amylovorans]